ncbi:MAG TPA: type 1 glutamine amidotransferase domain-containing protein [Ilumatobacteraceae bacterium]|nr:type 1 glutamine amidotransferase domain-containing protein [Ilumatobacteraceae bacterium]
MARIAFVLGNDFEDVEFEQPTSGLRDHDFDVIGTDTDAVTGKRGTTVSIDKDVDDASVGDYDALVIPGGFSPDHLRTDSRIVDFVRAFGEQDKVIAAVCHGPSLLIEAGLVDGRTMTSWPSIRTDLRNAGADVVDREVVVDGKLITSRNPDDLPAFTDTLLTALEATERTGDRQTGEDVLDAENSFTA